MWVRSEYTSELAVLAAWVSLLVPWNISYNPNTPLVGMGDAWLFFVRFPLFEFQLRNTSLIEETAPVNGSGVEENITVGMDITGLLSAHYPGTEIVANLYVTSPPTSALFYSGQLAQASVAWSVAALAFLVAFALSIALYLREEDVIARLPVNEVRLMGALLGLGALGTGIGSALQYAQRDIVGTPIPVGVVVIGVFALVLLRIETIEPDEESAEEDVPASGK